MDFWVIIVIQKFVFRVIVVAQKLVFVAQKLVFVIQKLRKSPLLKAKSGQNVGKTHFSEGQKMGKNNFCNTKTPFCPLSDHFLTSFEDQKWADYCLTKNTKSKRNNTVV